MNALDKSKLVKLPRHPTGLAWPDKEWPKAELDKKANATLLFKTLDAAFAEKETDELGETQACVIIHKGRLVHERYAEEFNKDSSFISWSMAKSILQALVGILVKQGKLDIDNSPNFPEWSDDERKHISLDQLLRMVDGLNFNEDYVDDNVDGEVSHVIEMLFNEEHSKDMAAYAMNRALKYKPGEFWNYSSGTSNIISKLVSLTLKKANRDYTEFMQKELFQKIAMHSASPKFDAAGTFVGSSFVYATAQDFAKFGYLYLRNGNWNGEQILPESWVDYTRTPTEQALEGNYASHFWLVPGSLGIFSCNGYEGQRIMIVPKLDLIIVRLGKTPIEKVDALNQFLKNIVDAFRPTLD